MQWYYIEKDDQKGPVSEEEFSQLVKTGAITHHTMVWREGFENWIFYGDLLANQETRDSVPGDGSAICCECGKSFPIDQLIPYEELHVCGTCKNLFFQRLREGAAIPGRMQYAGFWIRFGAKFLDGIILTVFNQLLQFGVAFAAAPLQESSPEIAMAMGFGVWGLQLLVGVAYCTFFVGRYGATPGKMACKLRIVRSDGTPISYGRACGRYFAEILSQMILYIGYIMVAFDDEKRALHDRICDTRVIKVG